MNPAPAVFSAPPETEPDHFGLYIKTAAAWDAMYEDCRQAKSYIRMEQYIFLDDQAGRRFLQLFCSKLQQGVRVNLLFDSIGSMGMASSPLVQKIRELGGTVNFYNPVGLFNIIMPSRLYPRSHTKMLLIDDAISYVGSACIDQRMKDWADLHLRIRGPIAEQMRRMLDRGLFSTRLLGEAGATSEMHYDLNLPHMRRSPVYRELLRAIMAAERSICLVTPYFLPPWRLRRALYGAVKRGVDVRVMISEKSDVRIADLVTRSYLHRLLQHGLRIHLYRPSMLHAKYAVIDDDWASIGSTNLDYLSLRHNREGNLLFYETAQVMQLRDIFETHIDECLEVDEAFCKSIPLSERVLGILGRVVKRAL